MTKSERHKQWVAANRDRARAYEKSAKVQAYRKAYYQANKERWREKVREFRHKRQALLRAAKDVPCTDCGIQYPPYVMDFDHVRGEKYECVGKMILGSLERMQTEIAKCDVVCSNCHRIRTHTRKVTGD